MVKLYSPISYKPLCIYIYIYIYIWFSISVSMYVPYKDYSEEKITNSGF